MAFTNDQLATIKAAWNDPNRSYQDKMKDMQTYGVDVNAISQATGANANVIGNTLMANGAQRGFGGYAPGITDTYAGTYKTPAQQQAEQQAAAAEASRGVTVGGGANLGFGNTQPNNDETVAYRGGSKNFNESAGGASPSAQPTGYDSYTPNPYLGQMAQGISQQMNDNFTRNLMPAMRSGAMVAGGFGGSRQGVVEANALKDLNSGMSNAITNLYGADYNNAQNRNFNYAQLDSSNAQFGANYGLNALNAQNQWANNNVNTANQMQNAPIDYNRYFTNQTSQIAGQGGTNTATTNNQGNPFMSAAGGALTAAQIYKAF